MIDEEHCGFRNASGPFFEFNSPKLRHRYFETQRWIEAQLILAREIAQSFHYLKFESSKFPIRDDNEIATSHCWIEESQFAQSMSQAL